VASTAATRGQAPAVDHPAWAAAPVEGAEAPLVVAAVAEAAVDLAAEVEEVVAAEVAVAAGGNKSGTEKQ
jgi:hypothetical protein